MGILVSIPSCGTASAIAAALHPSDAARLARARGEADERPIPYPLGSGEADEVALYAGFKPLIRQVLSPPGVRRARARFEALGLVMEETTHIAELPSTVGSVLFVGRDRDRVRAAAACEARPDHDLELGELLGYPRCCVEAYLAIEPPRHNAWAFARAATRSGGAFEPRLNTLDLSVFHYVSWLPCSFSCAPSKRYADAVANHIARRHGQFVGKKARVPRAVCPPGCRHEVFVTECDRALAAHRLVVIEDVQISIAGTLDGEHIHVERAWPTARDRHPDVRLDAQAREAAARLTAIVDAAATIAVERGILFVDGAPVLRSDDLLLAPFGAASASYALAST